MHALRTLGRLARALLCAAALVALAAGVPAALWKIGQVLGPDLPGRSDLNLDLILKPDDGGIAFALLLGVGWLAWVAFVVSLLLEIPAALRGRTRRHRVRGLGWSQHLAAVLLGGLFLTASAGAAVAASTPASAASVATAPGPVASATLHPGAADSAPTTARSEAAAGPVYVVERGDSLWSIAEKVFQGDGSRWHDIAAANEDRVMPNGVVFDADRPIEVGWRLNLPAGAVAPATGVPAVPAEARSDTDPAPGSARTVTVEPGDTLSEIAERTLGDADRYPEIVDANRGVPQADGAALTDPDLIMPGWELKVPGAAAVAPPDTAPPAQAGPEGPAAEPAAPEQPSAGPETAPAPPTTEAPTAEAPAPQAPVETPQADAPSTQGPSVPGAVPDGAAAPAPAAAPQTPAPAAPQTAEAAKGSNDATLKTTVAVGSLLAAGLLGVIGFRRVLQQRRRRPQRRIPMPKPETAAFERQLRLDEDPVGIDFVDRALRTLAANAAQDGRALPPVEAVQISARGVTLHLGAPTPPLAPFTAVDGDAARWWCPSRGRVLLEEEAADLLPSPYPALVALGATTDGDLVLVDLEAIALLRLDGNANDVRDVMLALAVELAVSPLRDHAAVTVAGFGADLERIFPNRVAYLEDLAAAVDELRAHDALHRGALARSDAETLYSARLLDDGADVWTPLVVLSADGSGDDSGDAVVDETVANVLANRPRTGTAVVTDVRDRLDLPSAWTLPAAPGASAELPGLDLAVTLHRLDPNAYAQLLELVDTADRVDDLPAPAWTRLDETEAPLDRPRAVAAASADGAPDTGADENPHECGVEDTAGGDQDADDAHGALPAGASDWAADWTTAIPPLGGPRGTLVSAVPSEADDAPETDDAEDSRPAAAPQEGTDAPDEAAAWEQAWQDAGLPAPSPAADAAASGDTPAEVPQEDAADPAGEAPAAAGVTRILDVLIEPAELPDAPQIRVLGPVDIVGAQGRADSNRRRGLTELAAWLVLNPGRRREDLDDAIWPGHRVPPSTRNTSMSQLRKWMGRDPALDSTDPNAAYLPPVVGDQYAFSPSVSCDWHSFQELYRYGSNHRGPDADTALACALALVRGRPFADIDPAKYTWAEPFIQEMVSSVVDAAHELAERRLAVHDYHAAGVAIGKGLMAVPESELLYRDKFRVCAEAGDRAGLERAAAQLTKINDDLGTDPEQATVDLLNALLTGHRIASAM